MKSLRNPSRKPTHPGAVLREDLLPDLGFTHSMLASDLDLSEATLCEILNEKRSLTVELAVPIANVFGGSPESWLQMQDAADFWDGQSQGWIQKWLPF
jgi:addiction module HigA family antidote